MAKNKTQVRGPEAGHSYWPVAVRQRAYLVRHYITLAFSSVGCASAHRPQHSGLSSRYASSAHSHPTSLPRTLNSSPAAGARRLLYRQGTSRVRSEFDRHGRVPVSRNQRCRVRRYGSAVAVSERDGSKYQHQVTPRCCPFENVKTRRGFMRCAGLWHAAYGGGSAHSAA
jgi:hypothetical protein